MSSVTSASASRPSGNCAKTPGNCKDYYDQTQAEQQLALRLMEKQLHRVGLQDARLRYRVIPAEHFSGDIVAAARSTDGRFYVLLADATGTASPQPSACSRFWRCSTG